MTDPKRGEVWLVDLGLAAKVRPCLVVSITLEEDDRALIAVVTRTTQQRGSRFEVEIALPGMKKGAFDVQNLVTAPRAKFIRKLAKLSLGQMGQIEKALMEWLGIHIKSSNNQPGTSN